MDFEFIDKNELMARKRRMVAMNEATAASEQRLHDKQEALFFELLNDIRDISPTQCQAVMALGIVDSRLASMGMQGTLEKITPAMAVRIYQFMADYFDNCAAGFAEVNAICENTTARIDGLKPHREAPPEGGHGK